MLCLNKLFSPFLFCWKGNEKILVASSSAASSSSRFSLIDGYNSTTTNTKVCMVWWLCAVLFYIYVWTTWKSIHSSTRDGSFLYIYVWNLVSWGWGMDWVLCVMVADGWWIISIWSETSVASENSSINWCGCRGWIWWVWHCVCRRLYSAALYNSSQCFWLLLRKPCHFTFLADVKKLQLAFEK